MNFFERNFKPIAKAVGSALGGLIAGVGSAIPVPILGGAILTGTWPLIAAAAVAGLCWFGLSDCLDDIAVIRVVPTAWEVQYV